MSRMKPLAMLFAVLYLAPVVPAQDDEAPDSATVLAAVPDAAALREAQRLVDQIYDAQLRSARTPEQRLALARDILAVGQSTLDNPTGRYALLSTALNLAIQAGDAEVAVNAIDALAAGHEINAAALKSDALRRISGMSVAAAEHEKVARLAAGLIEQALRADDYESAQQLASVALVSSRRTNDPAAVRTATTRAQQVREMQQAHREAARAEEILTTNPDNSQANLALGRFLCIYHDDWEGGLPLLAKGSDPDLRALAEREQSFPSAAEAQLELGDLWWSLSAREGGHSQRQMRARAAHWYEQAQPSLDGLARAMVDQRLAQVGGRPTRAAPSRDPRERLLETTWLWSGDRRIMGFGPDGQILAGRDRSLERYQFKDDRLEIFTADGRRHSEYRFDAERQVWVQVPFAGQVAARNDREFYPSPRIDASAYRPTGDDARLTQLLRSRSWRLHWGRSSRTMRFGANGVILEGAGRGEVTYRVVNGRVEFINGNGYLFSRLVYDRANNEWRRELGPDEISGDATFRLRPE